MYYLLEWSTGDDTDLETFKKLPAVTETLQMELEVAWETGGIFDVLNMSTYDSGTLTPLMLFLAREVPELDGVTDMYYEIRDHSLVTVAEFIVRKGN